jgi:signal transduction histidine kinase/ligand-binding sensor domain-containing protein
MTPINKKFQIRSILFLLIILLVSCNNYKEAPPFPYSENEYEQPITKSFEFSETDTIEWITKDPSQIKPLPKTKFSWNKIPSKPFDVGIPYGLKQPLPSKPFDLDSLPDSSFSYDSLPKRNLKIKVTVLGDPKIVKAANPVTLPQSTRGVMSIDSNFGLPGLTTSSLKDREGMLWFGTNNGIARYDSENIEIYGLDQGLNLRNVFVLFEDSKGRLWVGGSLDSVTVIDFEANLIYEISSSFNSGQIYGIMETKDGKIWIANSGVGYNIIDLEKNTIRQFNVEHGLLNSFSISPFQDDEGLIWLSTGQGINILDLKTGKNIKFTMENGLLANFVIFFYQDEAGKLWISEGAGFQILDNSKTEIYNFTEAEGLDGMRGTGKVIQDKSGKHWLSSSNGLLFSYIESSGLIEKYALSNSESQVTNGILIDNQGQVWSSMFQGGLFKIDLKSGRPGNYVVENGLTDNRVWCTLEAKDDKIWIGTNGGIDVYDPEKKTIKHLGTEQGLVHINSTRLMEDAKGRIWVCGNNAGVSIIDPVKETIQRFTPAEGLDTDRVRSILEDRNGLIWMGGNNGELLTIDLENSIFKSVVLDTTQTQVTNNILIQDATDQIWVGGLESGIQKIDPKTNTRARITTANGLVDDRIYSMIEDEQNNIWAVTHTGVEKINVTNKELTTFTTSEGLGANDVYDIIQQKSEIYLGTSQGLTILKPIDNGTDEPYWKVKTIGKNQGLNLVDFSENSFTFDKNGRLWTGVQGLMLTVMDEIKEDTTDYPTTITGINIIDAKRVFYDQALINEKRAKEDTLWARGKNEFYIIDKADIDSSYHARNNIHWTSVKGAYNIPVDLSLPHTQNYLSFNFNGGQFANPDKVVYRYILEGIDKNWSPVSEKTISENYRDLPPGEYTFKVSSKGFGGVWSIPSELSFSIIPPWWQTWWAYTIFVVLFLGMGLVIIHYRSQYLKNENRILEERVNERTAELKKTIEELENTQSQLIHSEKMASLGELTAGIAHEIQNPMNFINNFSEVSIELIDEMSDELDKGDIEEAKSISKDISQNLDKITHHGKRASSIVKGMLEHSRNTSGQKELTDINVLADEYLRLAYHGLRAKNKSFNADFKTDLDDTIDKIEVIPQDLGRVLLNLINNAFYAVTSVPIEERDKDYKPLVTVSTKKFKDQVLITIKDNGPGIPKEIKDKIFQPFFTTKPTGKGTGLGLSLAYDIVTQGHGGSIELDTAPGEGTEFSIYIPF